MKGTNGGKELMSVEGSVRIVLVKLLRNLSQSEEILLGEVRDEGKLKSG